MKKTGIIAIIMMGVMAIVAVLYLGLTYFAQTTSTFAESGYVLVPDALNSEDKQQNFLAGTTYKSGTGDTFVFQNDLGEEVVVTQDSFLHYSDGSISSMAQGVIAKMDEIENVGFMNYYSLSPETILRASGDGYSVDNQGVALEFTDFIWKISDNKYVIVSDSIDVHFSSDDVREVSNFVEISYVDDSVVRIQTEENLWQTISPNCYATLADGKIVDFNNRLVTEAGATEPIFYLTNMVINADDNIPIYNQKDVENADLTIPEFDIKAVDGSDGIAGQEGTSGEIGVDGEEGEKGEEGDEGEQGDDGDEGDSGSAGSSGSSGSSGSDGSTGATGGTAGDTGSDDSTEDGEGSVVPTFTVTNWSVSATNVTCTITASDDSGALTSNGSIIIYESSTNKQVYSEDHDFMSVPTTNDTYPDVEELSPDTQYRLVVFASYTDGDVTYSKEFVSKTFYTDSAGVSLETLYAATNASGNPELNLNIHKEDFSSASDVYVYMFESKSVAESFTTSDSNSTDMFVAEQDWNGLISGQEQDEEIVFDVYNRGAYSGNFLEANTTYYFRVIYKIESQSVLVDVVYSMNTLKEAPTVEAPTVVENKGSYSFDIYPDITDPDNGVAKVTYNVYFKTDYDSKANDLPSPEAYVITYDTNATSIPLVSTGLVADQNYVMIATVEFYDGEKTVTYTSPVSNTFMMSGGVIPSVSFDFSEIDGTVTGTEAGNGAVPTSIYPERIVGEITLNANSGTAGSTNTSYIDVSKGIYVTITSPGVYQKTVVYTSDQVEDDQLYANGNLDGVVTINSLDMDSLKEETNYTFSVSAYVDYSYTGGTANSELTVLGSFVVATCAHTSTMAVFSSADNDENIWEATISLTNAESGGEELNATYSMSTASRMEISIYSGIDVTDSTKLVATKIYDDDENESTNYVSGIKADFYDSSAGVTLTDEDFPDVAFTSSTYTLEISKLYDYTYDTVYDNTSRDEGIINTYANEIYVANNTYKISASSVPPDLPIAGQGVTVTEIKNSDAASYGGVVDSDLSGSAIVGYALESTYDNDSELGVNMKFYAFEYADWYNNSGATQYTGSISGNYTNTAINEYCGTNARYDMVTAGSALFQTEDLSFTATGIAPKAVFFFGTNPSGVDEVTYSNGYYVHYTGNYSSTNKTGISRGMQLIFGYTVGLNAGSGSGTTVTRYYPYVKMSNYATDVFTTTSPAMDLPKTRPTIYAYPWAADSNYSVWKYWTYDADGTIVLAGDSGTTAEWYKDSQSYDLSSYGYDLPGLNMTDSAFVTTNGADSRMTISQTSTVEMKDVVIPISDKTNATSIQMSAEVELYLFSIYGSYPQSVITSACDSENLSGGSLLRYMPVFRVYVDPAAFDIVDGEVNVPAAPTFTMKEASNQFTVDFTNIFAAYSSGVTNDSTLQDLQDRMVGVVLKFTGTQTGKVVTLYKTIDPTTGYITGAVAELADLADETATITCAYLYPAGNVGFYNVGSNAYYALQNYTSGGVPTTYLIPNTAGDDLKDTTVANTPAMQSLFTSSRTATLGSSASVAVWNGASPSSWIVDKAFSSHANLYYTSGSSNSYIAPVALEEYGQRTISYYEDIPYGVPLIYFDTDDAVELLNTITMNNITLTGATSANIGSTIYFKIQNNDSTSDDYGQYVMNGESEYWSLTITPGDTVTIGSYTFGSEVDSVLDQNTSYIITVYAKQDGGTGDYVQLLNGYDNGNSVAYYYLGTKPTIGIENVTLYYTTSTYYDKMLTAYFGVSQISGFNMNYTIYEGNVTLDITTGEVTDVETGEVVDTISNNGSTTAVNAVYNEDTTSAFDPSTNTKYIQLGPDDDVQLASGEYTLIMTAVSKTQGEDGSYELVGATATTFEVPEIIQPDVIFSTTPTYSDNNDGNDNNDNNDYGLNVYMIVLDNNAVLTANATDDNKGDYIVKIFEYEDGAVVECVYTSDIFDTNYARTLYVTGLKQNTDYLIKVYAILDEDSDGYYEDANGDLVELPTLSATLIADEDSLPSYIFTDQYLASTMDGAGVEYGTYGVVVNNVGGDVVVEFTGATGLEDSIASAKCYITVLYSTTGAKYDYWTTTINDPTFTVINESQGNYQMDTGYDVPEGTWQVIVNVSLYDTSGTQIDVDQYSKTVTVY